MRLHERNRGFLFEGKAVILSEITNEEDDNEKAE